MAKRKAADPVLAAITRHRDAWAKYVELDNEKPRNDDAHARARRKTDAALAKLLRTAPATLAGVRTAVEYFVEWDENCIPADGGEYLRTLARSPALAMAGESVADRDA